MGRLMRGYRRLLVAVMAVLALGDWGYANERFDQFVEAYGADYEMLEVKKGRVVVLLDEELVGQHGEVMGFVAEMDGRDRTSQEQRCLVERDIVKIGEKIDELLGGEFGRAVTENASTGQLFTRVAGESGLLGVVGGELRLAVVERGGMERYLATGGNVPGHKRLEDGRGKMSYEVKSGVQHGELKYGEVAWVIPVDKEQAEQGMEAALLRVKEALLGRQVVGRQGMWLGVVVHEIAEGVILRRLGGQSLHSRWFTDGMAEAVTWIVLRDLYGEQMAEQWVRDTSDYEDMVEDVDLLRWENKAVAVNVEVQQMAELSAARYAFAAEEMRRLVEIEGEGVFKQLIDEAVRLGEKGGATDRSLVDAAKQIDPDFLKQMVKYRRFEGTQEDMVRGYMGLYRQAVKDERWGDALVAYIHLKEQRDQVNLNDYWRVVEILMKEGHASDAERVLLGIGRVMQGQREKSEVQRMLVRFYLSTGQQDKAGEIAEVLLQAQPEDSAGLLARMLRLMKLQKYEQAKVAAERLLSVSGEGSLEAKAAMGVIAWYQNNIGLVGAR